MSASGPSGPLVYKFSDLENSRKVFKRQGLSRQIWEKAPGLNWEKNMQHLGTFWEFFRIVNCKIKFAIV